ncbi:hypothetical protein ACWGJP_00565 [Microbacterium sp. NPDC055903]
MTDPQQPYGTPPPPPFAPPAAPAGPIGTSHAPTYQAPVGAYQVPVGGYAQPSVDYAYRSAPEKRSSGLGAISLILSMVAAVVMPIIGGLTAYVIGKSIPGSASDLESLDALDDLSILSPVRDQVLWAELSFWAGTLLGIAAIVLAIVAIVQRRGRGQGIAGLIIAVVGPVIFGFVVYIAVIAGAVAGATAGFTAA